MTRAFLGSSDLGLAATSFSSTAGCTESSPSCDLVKNRLSERVSYLCKPGVISSPSAGVPAHRVHARCSEEVLFSIRDGERWIGRDLLYSARIHSLTSRSLLSRTLCLVLRAKILHCQGGVGPLLDVFGIGYHLVVLLLRGNS